MTARPSPLQAPGAPAVGEEPVARPGIRVASWCLYDWANSAYAAVVLSFIFAPYFLSDVSGDTVGGTVQWTTAMTVSALAVGILSPILGALGDRGGRRMRWLITMSAVAIIATAGLWHVEPDPSFIPIALVLLVVSNTAFELGYVFYNAMLPEVASEKTLGRVSGMAWGLGYLGSLVILGLCYAFLVDADPPLFGLDGESRENLRATALVAALWFLVFALPLFVFGPRDRPSPLGSVAVVKAGLADLWQTIRGLPRTPSIAWYLGAHMVYIDGINTLLLFGPLFAAGSFGFTASEVLVYGISFFLVAGIGSFVLGWLDDKIGSKPIVMLSIGVIAVIVLAMVWIEGVTTFWIVSMILAFFIGPVQSVSRSLMARLAPAETRTQLFGLYALAGRATAPLGPALLSWLIAAAGTQRAGAAVIFALCVLGLLLLIPVREPDRAALARAADRAPD